MGEKLPPPGRKDGEGSEGKSQCWASASAQGSGLAPRSQAGGEMGGGQTTHPGKLVPVMHPWAQVLGKKTSLEPKSKGGIIRLCT